MIRRLLILIGFVVAIPWLIGALAFVFSGPHPVAGVFGLAWCTLFAVWVRQRARGRAALPLEAVDGRDRYSARGGLL